MLKKIYFYVPPFLAGGKGGWPPPIKANVLKKIYFILLFFMILQDLRIIANIDIGPLALLLLLVKLRNDVEY